MDFPSSAGLTPLRACRSTAAVWPPVVHGLACARGRVVKASAGERLSFDASGSVYELRRTLLATQLGQVRLARVLWDGHFEGAPRRGSLVAVKTYARSAFGRRGCENAAAELGALQAVAGHPGVITLHEVCHTDGALGARRVCVLCCCVCARRVVFCILELPRARSWRRFAPLLRAAARTAAAAYVRERADAVHAVMEYADGGDLFEWLETHGAVDVATAGAVTRELAGALAHIHSRGIAHRDVSPENIVLASSGGLKLLDFGLCGEMDTDGMLPARTPCGKAFYTSPELLQGGPHAGGPADMWALGTIIFLLLTGTPAWEIAAPSDGGDGCGGGGDDAFVRVTVHGQLEALLRERGVRDCPRDLLALLGALLDADPARRPSAAEVLACPWVATSSGATAPLSTGALLQAGGGGAPSSSRALSPSVSPRLSETPMPAAAMGGPGAGGASSPSRAPPPAWDLSDLESDAAALQHAA
jgi:serine/threonine protein kinase